MRIALVASFGLRAKGTARARALPLAIELARRGHAVALFAPPYDSPEDSGRQWREEVGASGVDVINTVLPSGRQTAAWHLRLSWRLFLAVRGWRPDVVHIFKPKGPSGLAGTLLWVTRRRIARHPRVIIDADDWEGPGGWNDDPRVGYFPAQRRFFAWQERYGLSHADAWTVASRCLRDRAIAFGAAPEHVYVLHNGVRLSTNSRQQIAIQNPKSAILYTRFAGVRPADVASLWSQVQERLPDARLIVVGRGLSGEERSLERQPGIEVRGWVEPAELPAVLAGATLAIAPWADTPSNRARHSAKILELMAAGLPVVATAVGELPATLGETGVLVPPGDSLALAAAVVALLADPATAEALGMAARERVRLHFSWAALVADVALAAYEAAAWV